LLDISGFLHAAFSDIRRNSNRNAAVTVRLVQALTTLAHYGNTPNRRDHLRQHVAMIERAANEFIHEPNDLQYVKECIGDFHAILAAQA
jgi:uncharacterized membrane protein